MWRFQITFYMKRFLLYLIVLFVMLPLGGVTYSLAQTQKKTVSASKKTTTSKKKPVARKQTGKRGTVARKTGTSKSSKYKKGKKPVSHVKTYHFGNGQKAVLNVKPQVQRVVTRKNGRRIVRYKRVYQPPISLTFDGIDISHYQHYIHWKEVATNNIQFAYVKATEGEMLRDEYYETNISRARAADLKVGSYLFFRPSVSAKRQFENFRAIVREENQDLLPMVDVEECDHMNRRMVLNRLKELLDLMTDYYGQKPLIYTMTSFYNTYLQNEFTDYPFMLGGYTRKPVLLDGKDYVVWQFSAHGRVPGIVGNVDLDVFNEGHNIGELLFDHSKFKGVKIQRKPIEVIPEDKPGEKLPPLPVRKPTVQKKKQHQQKPAKRVPTVAETPKAKPVAVPVPVEPVQTPEPMREAKAPVVGEEEPEPLPDIEEDGGEGGAADAQ